MEQADSNYFLPHLKFMITIYEQHIPYRRLLVTKELYYLWANDLH